MCGRSVLYRDLPPTALFRLLGRVVIIDPTVQKMGFQAHSLGFSFGCTVEA